MTEQNLPPTTAAERRRLLDGLQACGPHNTLIDTTTLCRLCADIDRLTSDMAAMQARVLSLAQDRDRVTAERANHVMVPREVADKALPLILHEVTERSDVRWWAEAGERTGAYSQGTADRWEAERQALEALAVALAAQKEEQTT